MKKIVVWLTAAFFTLPASAQDPVKLDGKADAAEWKNAETFSLQHGGTIRLVKTSTALYLAVLGDGEGWSHIYLQKGDSIFVMHASAALGTAIYIKEVSIWKNVQGFTWGFRAMMYNDGTKKVMDDHVRQHGWVANNNNMGNKKTMEYKIDLIRFADADKIAFVYAMDANNPSYFPTGLKDGTISSDLVFGNAPEILSFDPSTWKSLD